MIIHTVLKCGECKFFTDEDYPWCSYHSKEPEYSTFVTIPDWCTLRTDAILVMTDPIKLRKEEVGE
jgi:hypothetical protein